MYVLALDLSLVNTGLCIFEENGTPVKVFSVSTNSKHELKERLKTIADCFVQVKKQYEIGTVVLERGFTAHNLATQQLFRVHGIANLIFYKSEQIYYPPSTIKKIITGSGKADKAEVRKVISEKWPELKIENFDQSDAVAIGYSYFIDKKIL